MATGAYTALGITTGPYPPCLKYSLATRHTISRMLRSCSNLSSELEWNRLLQNILSSQVSHCPKQFLQLLQRAICSSFYGAPTQRLQNGCLRKLGRLIHFTSLFSRLCLKRGLPFLDS